MTDLTQKFNDALAAVQRKPDLHSRMEALEGIGKKLEAEMGKTVTEQFLDHEATETVAALAAGVVAGG